MEQAFLAKLGQTIAKERVKFDEPMASHITFRVGGVADVYATPTAEELPGLLALAKEYEVPVTVIGNGSNLLVRDGGIRGLVIEIGAGMSEVKMIDDKTIYAQAGAMLFAVARLALDQSLTGFEFAAGIPGSVGGAVVMNAGAYGGEMKDVLVSVEVLTPEHTILTLPVEELDLSYRHSIVTEKGYLVLSATLRLLPGDKDAIGARMAELREQRVSKQPLEYPSAGSTFKRPEGYFAGKLIEDAGLRGYCVGDAQVSEKHCGFVVNKGNATASQLLQLMADVQAKVQEQFGVTLEPEVRILGEE